MKILFRTLTLVASSLALAAGTASKSVAQAMPVCPTSGTATRADMANYPDGCKATPERYQIVIYEMGLCTSNPLSGTTYDPSSCVATYLNTSGQTVNLAGGTVSFNLDSGNPTDRPENGTYTHAIIHIANTFGLRGSYELTGAGGATWYSDGQDSSVGTNASSAISTAVNFTETLTTFGDPNSDCTPTAFEDLSGGRLEALLVNSSNSSTCTGASKIIGSFAPTSPLVIDDSTTGMDVAFTVTNNGMSIGADPNTGAIQSFMSGPFNPIITVLSE